MAEPKLRFKNVDGTDYSEQETVAFGTIIEPYTEKTKTENEDVLLSCAIDGMYLNSELFGHQRGSSNIGYKKVYKDTLILSAQNLHLGNANVNQRFEHGIISPAYNTYRIVNCNPAYLAQWIKRDGTKQFFYNATTPGASECRRNVDWDKLYNQDFYLPSDVEQKRIVEFLSSVDELIATSEEEVANLEQQKKAAIQAIFSRKVRFKKEDGSDFPEWEETTFDKSGAFIKGAPLSKADISETGTPFILYGELYTTYKEVAYDIARRTESVVDEKYISKGGEVLIPTSGETREDIATATCVMTPGVILAGDLNIFRSNEIDGRIISCIVRYVINKQISKIAQGKSVVHISSEKIKDIAFAYPKDKDEQKHIADFLTSFDEAIVAAREELEKYKELKKGLLQQMFV